jgi:uncharacterized membrane protein YoaT (DUF817 family)
MYASVASYMCQAWRRMHLNLEHWPRTWMVILLPAAIYANFFTLHHFIPDFRWVLMLLVLAVFAKTYVSFYLKQQIVSDATGAVICSDRFLHLDGRKNRYLFWGMAVPNQEHGWHLVHISKISSWLLLVIVSFLIVTMLKRVKKRTGSQKIRNSLTRIY